jgi:hypothetical protein
MLQVTTSELQSCTCSFGAGAWKTCGVIPVKNRFRKCKLQGWLLPRQQRTRGTFRCRNGGVDIAKVGRGYPHHGPVDFTTHAFYDLTSKEKGRNMLALMVDR